MGPRFTRYAVYYTPVADSQLARFGAAWLGWDLARGTAMRHPDLAPLPAPIATLTEAPRKYGFHATIKPPFRLARGTTAQGLADALERLCVQMPPIALDAVRLCQMGRFLALCPEGDQTALNGMAALVTETLDAFRAPSSQTELDRRRGAGLSPRQEENLLRWGYPYVMEDFRFHMTLTGKRPKQELPGLMTLLEQALDGALPRPFMIDSLSLVGESTKDGRFHLLHSYPLTV